MTLGEAKNTEQNNDDLMRVDERNGHGVDERETGTGWMREKPVEWMRE